MNIAIQLHDGLKISAENTSFSAAETAATLNDRRIVVTSIGDYIINKNAIKMIAPIEDPEKPDVTVFTHDGEAKNLAAENYVAADIQAQINNPEILAIVIGDAVINKNTVKMIAPVTPTV
ncbi:hypothetical protein [Pseudobacillus badius]|uniref:hypothetical protein n=1 Tax=Bacillus badius TaxID=1455 RepID=UPI0024A386E1|nr:hypothetical protein [Bacillus badius]GLY09608.1 hypothetical protein Bbad01_08240 [Bacillus badius]